MGFFDNQFVADKKHQLTIHNHGHRCYTEGLSEHEKSLVALLARYLDSGEYFIFNNITLPSSYTITSQIDHVIVSKYGIFVIESKDYSGWIFGDKNNKNWTACYRGGKKYPFQNPLFQNFAHISSLKEQLQFLQKSFFSIVVFSEFCEFKTERIPNVIYDHELIGYIKNKKKVWLKKEEVAMTIGKLLMLCQTHNISKENHIQNLKSIQSTEVLTPIPKAF